MASKLGKLSTSLKTAAAKARTTTGTNYNQRLTGRPTGGAISPYKTSTTAKSTAKSSGSSYTPRSYTTYRAPTYAKSSGTTRSGGVGSSQAQSGGGTTVPVGWNPTGYAKGYLESAADLFAKDPTLMLKDLTTTRYGADGGRTIFNQLSPTIDNANALYLAMMGQDAGQGTNNEWINFLGSLIDQQLTPGQFFNWEDAVKNLFGAVEGSPLRSYLNEGDATEQTSNFNKLMGAILDTSFHPLFQESISKGLADAQQNYAIATAKAAQNPFIDYLKANNPNLVRLVGAA